MEREQLVCATCGVRFQLDDFTEDLGELVACPSCGSLEIEVERPATVQDEARRDAA